MSMKRIFNMFLCAVAVFFAAACTDDSGKSSGELVRPDKLYFPRDNYPVDITTGLSVKFEWANSVTDNVCYQVLFDRADGDFSSPAYVATSDANGFFPSLEIASTALSNIAALCGGMPGQVAEVKWTVRTFRGIESVTGVKEGGSRTLLIERPNTVDPLPAALSMQGSATEGQSVVKFNAALPLGKYQARVEDREGGAMECFTEISGGTFTLSDDLGRYYFLQDGGVVNCTYDEQASNTIAPGVYWIYVNFNTMSWKAKEISKVDFWTHPWFAGEDTAAMTYAGGGVWELVDYAWQVGNSSQHDTRYHFNVYYADGSSERWGFWDDDCRNNASPETDPKFYNVYRYEAMSDDWGHSWKSKNDSEGVGQKATMRVYINNEHAADYIHERSFK